MRAHLFSPTLSHDAFVSSTRFPAFDGVRAVAALMVVAYHFAGPNWTFLSGWLGVHLFFVLSGVLITTLLLREESANERVSLARFWIRHVFRILPAYYVALRLIVGTILLHGSAADYGSSARSPGS